MKHRLFLFSLLVTACSTLFGQGTTGFIAFQNFTSPDSRIYTNDFGQFGPTDGTNNYAIGLYLAPAGTTDFSLGSWQLIVTSTNRTGSFRGLFTAYNPLQLPSQYLAGTTYAMHVRGWDLWTGNTLVGASSIGSITPGGPNGPFPNVFGTGPGQVGGFTLIFVPEPSSLALLALGGILVTVFCGRRRSER
jgi:hypothetical protein